VRCELEYKCNQYGGGGNAEPTMTRATTKTVLMIAGMRDNACRQKIIEALEAITGVKDVDVSLYRACATVVHDHHCGAAELMQTVEETGYAAEPMVPRPRNGLEQN
jgi:copper chaperone CopZ